PNRSGGAGDELQGDAVHAVAQPGGLGTVVEDVAEMPATAAAVDGGARHAERIVLSGLDGIGKRRPETRPAGAAVEFGLRREQRQIASGTGEQPGSFLMQQRTGERPLRALL